jgi:hypothetical protein
VPGRWDADRYQRRFGFVSAMADYWRLRFVAVAGAGTPAGTARPAKLHRQMAGDRNR